MRSYTIKKAFSTIKPVKLVGKKEFAVAALNLEHKNFIIYITSFNSPNNDQKSDVHMFCKIQIAALVINKTSNSIFIEYFDFIDVFSSKLTLTLPKYYKINDYAIKLIDE